MMIIHTLERLKQEKIVAVVRHATQENILPIARSLLKGGIHAIEITAETPHASSLIEEVNQELGDQIVVGAGTVLDPETARVMIMAGARFIVAPTTNRETIMMTKRYGVISIPGAFTPTEVLTAYESGADMVKVFPAGSVGPSYAKNIKGPLPQVPLMATGGVDEDNMLEFLANGVEVVGLGSQLVNPKQLQQEEDYRTLEQVSKRFVEKVHGES